jgi:hypothetical protein
MAGKSRPFSFFRTGQGASGIAADFEDASEIGAIGGGDFEAEAVGREGIDPVAIEALVVAGDGCDLAVSGEQAVIADGFGLGGADHRLVVAVGGGER